MGIATEGSVVENCLIEYDADSSNALDPMTPGHGTQGVRLDSGKVDDGAVVRNCTIRMKKHASGRGAICVWGRSGHHEVHNCDIEIDEAAQSGGEAVPALKFEKPDFYRVNHNDTSIEVSSVSITGSASSGESIFVRDRPLTLEDVCVSHDRTPLRARECSPETRNSSLDADHCTVRTEEADFPDRVPSDPEDTRTFRIKGVGSGAKQYIFRLEQGGSIDDERATEDPDYAYGPAVFGEVGAGEDEYHFSGEIAGFLTIGGPVKTFVDGKEVKPWKVDEQ
jgi:hypothetical protein